jgi:predicted dehydrogenase
MTLRVGLVGTGFMGGVHAGAWANTPAKVVGLISQDSESLERIAEQTGATVYKSLHAMLPNVDVVDICTPTHLHYEMALEALSDGKHVVCEKPLARTLEQARAMVQLSEQIGVLLLVGHVVRFFPEYAQAKQLVVNGQIGEVAVTRLSRCSFKPARNNTDSWFHDHEKSGGMMLDLMIHDFDYAQWVSGEVESVYARHITERFPDAPGDYALAILKHTNGAISHIEGGWAYPVPMFRTSLEISGSQGLIEHPTGSSVPLGMYMHQTDSENLDIAIPASPLAEDPYTTQIKHFYRVIMGEEKTLRVTAHDAYNALKIALAAIESANTGKKIMLKG